MLLIEFDFHAGNLVLRAEVFEDWGVNAQAFWLSRKLVFEILWISVMNLLCFQWVEKNKLIGDCYCRTNSAGQDFKLLMRSSWQSFKIPKSSISWDCTNKPSSQQVPHDQHSTLYALQKTSGYTIPSERISLRKRGSFKVYKERVRYSSLNNMLILGYCARC
ncbi:hypothetical protein L873DRAFT_469365 [Choiromyces venosus 120613-1]|uniref:Uncharacterized protein n=1 Tax=Choiromyces venosus 120613-1 TaxID=1336337 RepID=A0A3N4J8Y1_9PEZI|nr:hypothetical protein L873DRAFT_469365 [Choiromyces venosus 120613-1]